MLGTADGEHTCRLVLLLLRVAEPPLRGRAVSLRRLLVARVRRQRGRKRREEGGRRRGMRSDLLHLGLLRLDACERGRDRPVAPFELVRECQERFHDAGGGTRTRMPEGTRF